jgi:hypothetical protein
VAQVLSASGSSKPLSHAPHEVVLVDNGWTFRHGADRSLRHNVARALKIEKVSVARPEP